MESHRGEVEDEEETAHVGAGSEDGAGGEGRVGFEAFENERDQSSEKNREDGVERERRADDKPEKQASFPEGRDGAEDDAQDDSVGDPQQSFLDDHAEIVARLQDAESEFADGDGDRLIAGATAHIGYHGEEDREGDGGLEGVFVSRDDAGGEKVEQDVRPEPRESSQTAVAEGHGAEFFTTDNTGRFQVVSGLIVGDGFINRVS